MVGTYFALYYITCHASCEQIYLLNCYPSGMQQSAAPLETHASIYRIGAVASYSCVLFCGDWAGRRCMSRQVVSQKLVAIQRTSIHFLQLDYQQPTRGTLFFR